MEENRAVEGKSTGHRFLLGRQSSLKPNRNADERTRGDYDDDNAEFEDEEGRKGCGDGPPTADELLQSEIPESIRLMYLANDGNVGGMVDLIRSGADPNFQDIDGRTALHVAACQGYADVVDLLLRNGASVDPQDRWGSTPLADAIHYKNSQVMKVLEKYGAKLQMVPMLVKNAREVPEYEIHPRELDFSNSVQISKGTFRSASWRGIQVAVKTLGDDFLADVEKVQAFRDELALLQQIRHPNVVQFLGAVTQSNPMMIVMEYLPKGDLQDYLKRKGALKPAIAVKFALDIARGLNYLHEHKPEPIIHRDLEPSNILRDDSSHLKVADFGVSKLLTKTLKDKPLTCEYGSCRYMAPEVFLKGECNTKADVFSFSLILQEMIEGHPPFKLVNDNDIPKSYAKKERPSFKVPLKLYSYGLKELIEECWSENPVTRPSFQEIINRLSSIQNHLIHKRRWKVKPMKCFQNLEAIWKKDQADPGSCSSPSSR